MADLLVPYTDTNTVGQRLPTAVRTEVSTVHQAGTTPGAVPVIKPTGDTRASNWEYTHNAEVGYLFHLLAGTSMGHNAAMIGLGIDNDGIGLVIPNKLKGRGIVGDQRATITAADAYWLHATQRSSLAPLVRLEMQANDATDVLQLLAFGTPGASSKLLYVGDPNGEAGTIAALDGSINWKRQIQLFDRSDPIPTFLTVQNNSGVPAAQRAYTRLGKSALEWWNYTGTSGNWSPFRISGGGSYLEIQGAANSTAVGTATYTNIIRMRNGQIGFYTATPVSQKARIGALTDSSGGTAGATLAATPAAYDQAYFQTVIASLAAKINALETTLSAAGGGIGVTA